MFCFVFVAILLALYFTMGVVRFPKPHSLPQNLEGYVTKFAPHKALKLIV